jgi:REP element-mobilizing transposase RayT
MPRTAREKSETGIYHVMLRGIDRMQLFYDSNDYTAFLSILARYKEICGFALYAYCMMGNHVHLLLKEKDVELAEIMKRIELSYSHYFNGKYNRSGYLFEGRYKSEVVLDDTYLLAVLRYIHNNPVKIGKTVSARTSYNDYIKIPRLVDVDFVLNMFHANREQARKEFREFIHDVPGTEITILSETRRRMNDKDAINLIKRIGSVNECGELAKEDRIKRDSVLAALNKSGLTIRQISRLTGINRNIVFRAGRND